MTDRRTLDVVHYLADKRKLRFKGEELEALDRIVGDAPQGSGQTSRSTAVPSQARRHLDMRLVSAIRPGVEAVRRELWGTTEAPFSGDLRAAAAWIEEESVSPAPALVSPNRSELEVAMRVVSAAGFVLTRVVPHLHHFVVRGDSLHLNPVLVRGSQPLARLREFTSYGVAPLSRVVDPDPDVGEAVLLAHLLCGSGPLVRSIRVKAREVAGFVVPAVVGKGKNRHGIPKVVTPSVQARQLQVTVELGPIPPRAKEWEAVRKLILSIHREREIGSRPIRRWTDDDEELFRILRERGRAPAHEDVVGWKEVARSWSRRGRPRGYVATRQKYERAVKCGRALPI